jgi:protein involved in temperature-dependent protein secretion
MANTESSENTGKPAGSSSSNSGGDAPVPGRVEVQAGDPYRPGGGNDYSLSIEPEDTGEATIANLFQAVPLENEGTGASQADGDGSTGNGSLDGGAKAGGLGNGGGDGEGDTQLPDGAQDVVETSDATPNDDGGLGDGAVPEARGLDPTLPQFDLGGDGIVASGSLVGDGTSGGIAPEEDDGGDGPGPGDPTGNTTVGPVSDSDTTGNEVSEFASGGDYTGVTAFADDPDVTDVVSYEITGGDDRFEIDPDTGEITVKSGSSFDAETESAADVEVTATSTDGSTSVGTFTISIGDENEAPVGPVSDSDTTGNEVSEFASGGDYTGVTAFADDPDVTDVVSYEITGGDDRFEIDPDTGEITVKAGSSFDAETESSADVEVTATSTDGSTSVGTFTISIGDENEAPVGPVTDSDTTGNEVSEFASGGEYTGVTAFADDPDVTDVVSYEITGGDDRFEIDPDTGEITVKAGSSFDAETESSAEVEVTATSSDGSTSTGTFAISIGDENEAPVGPVSDSDSTGNEVSEFASGGDYTGVTAFADDPDVTDVVSYEITGGDDRFEIDPDTGEITVKAGSSFDAETESSADVEVTATSTDGSTSVGTFTITIGDENEAPVGPVSDSDATGNEVSEFAGGGDYTGVTAFADDPDVTDVVSYEITGGDDRFEIDPDTGEITVKAGSSFDAETEDSVDVTVTATSSDGSTSTGTFSIDITDGNEPPDLVVCLEDGGLQMIQNGSFEVYDGPHGGSAGTGWYENPNTIDGWTYGNVDVHEAGHNNFGATDGGHHLDLAARTNGWISQEVEGQLDGQVYQLSFDMKSRGGEGQSVAEVYWNGELIDTIDPATTGSGWQTFSFNVVGGSGDGSNTLTFVEIGSDNNGGTLIDSVSMTADTRIAVVEEFHGAEIAPMQVFDPDAGDTHTFTVSDDRFEVVVSGDKYVLKLKDDQAFDYETETQVSVDVTVTDSGGLSDTETVVIDVLDIDESVGPVGPVADSDAALNSVAENGTGGEYVGVTAFAEDPDASDSVTYSITDDRFEIDPDTGVLTVRDGVSFDYEAMQSVDVEVTATSSDGSTSTGTFTVNITDVNEAPDLDFDPQLGPGCSVTMTFVEETAGYSNILGVFHMDGNGNPVGGEVVWVDQNQLVAGDSATIYLQGVEAGEIGYFLIPDGADYNSVASGDPVTFQKDGNGHWQAVVDGSPLIGKGANVFFSGDGSLNPDGYDHTVESGIRIGFEDLAGGGDEDFDDPVFDQTVQETDAHAAVYEEQLGAEVGTLSVFDPDYGDSHTFTVSDDRFEVVAQNGEYVLKLKDDQALDYETETQVTIEVTTTDSGGLSDSETIVIDVIDVEPEGPNDTNSPIGPVRDTDTSQNLVAATAAAGAVVGLTAFALDADAGDTVTYSIDDDRFDIDADTGVVTVADGAALIAGETIDVTITATSSDGSLSSATFPVEVMSGGSGNSPPDLIVGEALYRPDNGNKHWDDHHDGHWGHIKDGDKGHYHEDDGVHGQTYHGHDDDCGANEYHVPENEAGVELIQLSVVDPDVGDTHTFTVSDDRFEVISDGENYLLKLKDDVAVDYETEQTITIDVTATDSGGLSDTETITLDVVDVDESAICETGTSGADMIVGGDFGDAIYGLGGNDILIGQGGGDHLYGGSGDDVIRGGAGDDVMAGGDGSDLFAYMLGDGNDTISGGAGGNWIDIVDLANAADGTALGEYGTDWSITMTEGAIEDINALGGEITLSQDSGGYIELADGGRVDFSDLEGIQY